MSFRVINPIDSSIVLTRERGGELELPVYKNVWAPELTVSVVPSQVMIEIDGPVMLTGTPGVLLKHGLLISNEFVCNGYITTIIFNLSNKTVRIERGTAISRLIAL